MSEPTYGEVIHAHGWTFRYYCIIPGERECMLVRKEIAMHSAVYFGSPGELERFTKAPLMPEREGAYLHQRYIDIPEEVRNTAHDLLFRLATQEYLETSDAFWA